MVWFWLVAFTVMVLIMPEAFSTFWTNCKHLWRR